MKHCAGSWGIYVKANANLSVLGRYNLQSARTVLERRAEPGKIKYNILPKLDVTTRLLLDAHLHQPITGVLHALQTNPLGAQGRCHAHTASAV
jgi:hypothetical protein